MAHDKQPDTTGFLDPGYQTVMLLDSIRMRAYRRAIEAVVQPGDVVLDIGAGSGVLSMLAARAGASKVFAIERTGMAELARELIRANHLEDRVEVIQSNLEDIESLTPSPTVIVGEILGCFAPDEDQHRLYNKAARLCSEAPRLIPRAYQVVYAAAQVQDLEREFGQLDDLEGLSFGPLVDRLSNRVYVRTVPKSDLRGPDHGTGTIATLGELPASFPGRVTVTKPGPVNAIVASFVAELADDIELSTSATQPETSWRQVSFPLYPVLECKSGDVIDVEIWPRVINSRNTWAWRASCGDQEREGDAMLAHVGARDDILAAMGLQPARLGQVKPSRIFDRWLAALDAAPGRSVDQMIDTLLERRPADFADRADARQEVLRMLEAARALR